MKVTKKNAAVLQGKVRTLLFMAITFTIASCSDDSKSVSYDPGIPVQVNELSPTTGGYFDKVILRGENFGNNPKNVRVFFNKKEAFVAGASGDHLLVYVPKLPGEDCKIGILMNENTTDTIFCKQHFKYIKRYQLQYVAGQVGLKSDAFDQGDFTKMHFANSMEYLTSAPNNIVYISHYQVKQDWTGCAAYLNMSEQRATFMERGHKGAPYYDNVSEQVFYVIKDKTAFTVVDPSTFAFRTRSLIAPNQTFIDNGYKPLPSGYTLTNAPQSITRASDGKESWLYGRTQDGTLYRFKPENMVYDIVKTDLRYTTNGETYICTDPDDDTKVYTSLRTRHIITCIDLTKDPNAQDYETIVCGIDGSGTGDFVDGNKSIAKLNDPRQIAFARDPETNEKIIYICDADNRRIRSFNLETNLMTTVAGTGENGYATGDPATSMLSWPTGVCVTEGNDIYICDQGNRVVMKIEFM